VPQAGGHCSLVRATVSLEPRGYKDHCRMEDTVALGPTTPIYTTYLLSIIVSLVKLQFSI